jgi:hypothetical protein
VTLVYSGCDAPLAGVALRCSMCLRPPCVECGAPATEDGERYCTPCFDEALMNTCACGSPAWEPGAGVCEDRWEDDE